MLPSDVVKLLGLDGGAPTWDPAQIQQASRQYPRTLAAAMGQTAAPPPASPLPVPNPPPPPFDQSTIETLKKHGIELAGLAPHGGPPSKRR